MPLKICLEIAAVATVTALVLLKLQHCALSGGTMKKGKNVERVFGLGRKTARFHRRLLT